MTVKKLILNGLFLKFIEVYESIEVKATWDEFLAQTNLTMDDAKVFISLLNREGAKIEFDEVNLYASEFKFEIHLAINLALKNKQKEEKFCSDNDRIINRIDRSIVEKRKLNIELANKKLIELYPIRLVYIDGELSLIGECLGDKILNYFSISEFKNVNLTDQFFESEHSPIEINEFIQSLRVVNGHEERIILKVYAQDQVNLMPEHHFLGNPFVTSNGEGDLIWAADLELCEDVFQWLYSIKDQVEILDPGHIRKEFSLYCQNKKAS